MEMGWNIVSTKIGYRYYYCYYYSCCIVVELL